MDVSSLDDAIADGSGRCIFRPPNAYAVQLGRATFETAREPAYRATGSPAHMKPGPWVKTRWT
jgi:hypothetical protein